VLLIDGCKWSEAGDSQQPIAEAVPQPDGVRG
jgi:hypothetical protein